MTKVYVSVEQDPDTQDYFITFTDEMLEGLGWEEGTMVEWVDNGDGSWTLKKA